MAIIKVLLPSAYQQVEYIESTGTQFINSGFNAKDGFKIQMSFIITSLASRSVPFGYNGSSQESFFRVNANGSAAFWANTIGGVVDNLTISTNTKYDIECLFDSSAYLKVNGETKMSTTTTKSYYDGNIPILCCGNIGGQNNDYALAKLYSCKIYNLSGTLERDLIPCYRKSDNVIGLYDLVNDVFYTNAGSGTFTKGSDIGPQEIRHIYKGSTKVIKSYKGTNLIFADVPSTFQRVEYIESSGTQYIDSGFVPSNTSGAKIKFYKTNTTDLMYFGVREQTNTNSRWSIGTTISLYCGFNDIVYFELNGSRPSLNNNEIYNVEFNYKNDRKLKLNGDIGDNDLTNITLTNITKNAYIFAANWGGTANYFQSCRLYSLIFTDNDTIVRYFVPCYRKTDNEIGLYDVISGQFFTNNGTGTFGKGRDI